MEKMFIVNENGNIEYMGEFDEDLDELEEYLSKKNIYSFWNVNEEGFTNELLGSLKDLTDEIGCFILNGEGRFEHIVSEITFNFNDLHHYLCERNRCQDGVFLYTHSDFKELKESAKTALIEMKEKAHV